MNRQFLPAAILCSSIMLAGCGKTLPPEINQQPKEACVLLTQKMASKILGEDVPPSESKTMHSEEFGSTVTSCSYSTNGTNPTSIRTITILIRYAKDEQESKTIFTDAKAQSQSLSGTNPENLPSIGDEAYWVGGSLNQLNIRKGTGWYILSSYSRSDDPKQLELTMAKELFP